MANLTPSEADFVRRMCAAVDQVPELKSLIINQSGANQTDVRKFLRVGSQSAASTPGSVVKKFPVFDGGGNLLGYIPIYSAIS